MLKFKHKDDAGIEKRFLQRCHRDLTIFTPLQTIKKNHKNAPTYKGR